MSAPTGREGGLPLASMGGPTFLGHPLGLAYLSLTEAWERFSFYGMQALLVLYLVDTLLKPGHAEHVMGLSGLRAVVQGVFGPLSTQAFASEVFGLYAGFVYFTPVFGGFIGDRVLGQRRTVMLGALMMSAGHILMAFEAPFLIALILLIVGCGCLKGNISAQVGNLYSQDDPRRTRAFAIFNNGIQIGGLFGPIVCGLVGEVYGWNYGFAIAGALMLCGLATYAAGQRYMPPNSLGERRAAAGPKLDVQGWRLVGALLLVLVVGLFFSVAYYQLSDTYVLWVRERVNRRILGLTVPVPWFGAIDSFFTIVGTPLVIWLWRRQAARGREPGAIMKIAIGSAIVCCAYLLLMIASRRGGDLSMLWPLAFSATVAIGFLFQWPTTLALVSRAAPRAVNSTMMGVVFLTLFVGNNIVGWIGQFYLTMPRAAVWALQAAFAAAGALLAVLVNGPLSRALTRGLVSA
ncbi:MAG: peptide MFS transporter [Caulobacteraceae bacterium]